MNKNEMWVCAGDRLRGLRKKRGQSTIQVARQLGISGNYISEIARGKKSPSGKLIISLAEYYELDKRELLDIYVKEETEQAKDIKDQLEELLIKYLRINLFLMKISEKQLRCIKELQMN